MQLARYLMPIAFAVMFLAPASTNMVEVGGNDFVISNFGPAGDTSPDTEHPALAYSSLADEYFVVWRGDDYTYGTLADEEFEIWGRRMDADGTLLGGYRRCSFMGIDGDNSYNAEDPDVVFNPTSNEYFMVWEANHAVTGLEVAPTLGVYVLDGYGGVHALGSATQMTPPTPYFGFHIARDLELDDAGGYWALDGFGGVHSGGGAGSITPDTPYFGFDIARDMELAPGGGYYVMDSFGGVHPGGPTTAFSPAPPYFGFDAAGDLEIR